jgi:hypothetical protein
LASIASQMKMKLRAVADNPHVGRCQGI